MRQIDIAPTLSQALGIPVPKNAKGHVIAEALVR
jgi:arylsulfatase A-like enzyme